MAISGNQGATLPIGSNNYLASTTGTVQGARLRADVQAARRVVQSTRGIIINANITPILAATEAMKKSSTVYDYVAQHNEYDMNPTFVTMDDGTGGLGSGQGYDTADTTLIMSSGQGSRVVKYDILTYLGTGEIMWVTDRTGDTITVTRGYGSVAGTAIPANAELQILRGVFPENTLPPAATSTETLTVLTYLQCSRYSISASRRSMDSQNYALSGKAAVDEYERQHKAKIEEGKTKEEKSLLFNRGTTATSSATAGTMTDGIPSRILTNRFNMGGTNLDEVTLTKYAIAFYRYNQGSTKNCLHFIGDNMVTVLDSFARDQNRYVNNGGSGGMKDIVLGSSVKTWRSTAGDLQFTRHGLFGPLGSSALYSAGSPIGWMLSINFDNIEKLIYGANGNLKYNPNAATPGQDGEVGVWTEDYGIKMLNEKSFGFMYGIPSV